MKPLNLALVSLTAVTCMSGRAHSQGCDAIPPQSDFTMERIADAPGMAEDIVGAKDGRMFWVERFGDFKSWDPATKVVTTIKHFDVLYQTPADKQYYLDVETGLEGITLDPEFAVNHWVYLRYSVPGSGFTKQALGPIERLSRFTLKNNDKEVDMTTEKPILEYKVYAQCCHFGGDVEWGSDGNIWMTTGDNIHYNYTNVNPYQEANPFSDVRSTSANTNDLRGKTLRIRPIRFPDTETHPIGVGSTYTIPEGNLKDAWVTDLDKSLMRPEVYTMGHRNPFSISVHPDSAKHWLAIGEAGGNDQDGATGEDEVNLTTKPGYFGWPFFGGNNVPYWPDVYPGPGNPFANPQAPINESKWNTGMKTLPPAIPAAISPRTGIMKMAITCIGVTWGWVRYDASLNSKAKWPAYLGGKLLVTSQGVANVMAATVDETGKITKLEKLFSSGDFSTDVMKATQGADGAFYVLRGDNINFSTSTKSGVYRVAYKGSCAPVSARPDAARLARLQSQRVSIVHLGGNTDVNLPAGIKRAEAYGMDGRIVWQAVRSDASAEETRSIPASVTPGMLQLRYFQD